jgi:hypothetical protein
MGSEKMDLISIQKKNPEIPFIHVEDLDFLKYGRVLDFKVQGYLIYAKSHIKVPKNGVDYSEKDDCLMRLSKEKEWMEDYVYGQMPVEVGYCCGHNKVMNGMEWHCGCEVNIAITDFVLFLASFSSLELNSGQVKLNTADVQAVYVPKGYTIALNPLVLHFTPIEVEQTGFSTIVILPNNTNETLLQVSKVPYLKAKNSWIIYHKDTGKGNDFEGKNLKLSL